MPIGSAYVLIVSMDVDAEHEDVFNEVYDTEHVPFLMAVPGVRAVTRIKGEPFAFAMANAVKQVPAPSPVYTAIYEIDSPAVVSSPAWATAVEKGRWATEVRPYTSNRHHAMYAVRTPSSAR